LFDDVDEQKDDNNEILFNYYDGGFGNTVFVNKNVSLKVVGKHFVYKENNKEYHIYSSVFGVFKSVANKIKKQLKI